MILYMYIAPGQWLTIPWGWNLVNSVICCKLEKESLNSDLIQFCHDFIHVYSPRAGADSPKGTKFWCQQKCLVTSFICCKLKNNDHDRLKELSFPRPIEAPHKIWLQLARCLLRRRCLKMLTDGRRTTDDGRRMPTYTVSSPMSLRLRWAKKTTKNIFVCDENKQKPYFLWPDDTNIFRACI